MISKIFFNEKLKKYLVLNENNFKCKYCNSFFKNLDVVLIVEKYSIRFKNLFPDTLEFYCGNCRTKVKLTHEIQPTKWGVICDILLENSTPYIPKKPDLVNGDFNTFEAATKKIESHNSENIIDKTRLVGRESWGGASIGDSKAIEECKEKDKPPLKSPEELKQDILNFKISIDHNEKELLE
jgi:hypothetical protein